MNSCNPHTVKIVSNDSVCVKLTGKDGRCHHFEMLSCCFAFFLRRIYQSVHKKEPVIVEIPVFGKEPNHIHIQGGNVTILCFVSEGYETIKLQLPSVYINFSQDVDNVTKLLQIHSSQETIAKVSTL